MKFYSSFVRGGINTFVFEVLFVQACLVAVLVSQAVKFFCSSSFFHRKNSNIKSKDGFGSHQQRELCLLEQGLFILFKFAFFLCQFVSMFANKFPLNYACIEFELRWMD